MSDTTKLLLGRLLEQSRVMVSDETGKRIAEALERLAQAVEQRGVPPFPMGPADAALKEGE